MADQLDLAEAVAGLIDPRKVVLDRLTETGTIITERVTVSSLLDELSAAAGSTIGGEGRSRGKATGSPVDLAAVDLLDKVRVGTADWLELAGMTTAVPVVGYEHPDRVRRRREPHVDRSLRRLVVHSWHDAGRERDQLARIVAGWSREARALLDGERDTREVRGIACPVCGEDTVWKAGDGTEVVRGWPLVVDLRGGWVRGVECQRCLAYWWRSREDLVALAELLALDVDRVLLALSYYETVEAAGRAA